MADTKIDTIRHEAIEEPSGLALQCSCGTWAMLFRNSLGLDAAYEHAQHATRSIAVAAAESRGRAAGYAEAIADLRDEHEFWTFMETHPLGEDAVEVANNPGRVCADYLESIASRATTEETPR